MSGLRNYTAGTRAALQTLSRGSCYYPGCGEPVVRLVEGEYYTNYEIAHVRGAKEKGARHDSAMSDNERKAFNNLILLCLVHHKRVDRTHPEDYTPDMLLKWKAEREAGGQDALAGLTRLTEEDLQNVMFEAFGAKQDEILLTLERLATKDAEAAEIMQGLLDELDEMRTSGNGFNSDHAEILSDASQRLQHLGDNAEMLLNAAIRLEQQSVRSAAETLSEAAASLSKLSSLANSLNAAAARLEDMQGLR